MAIIRRYFLLHTVFDPILIRSFSRLDPHRELSFSVQICCPLSNFVFKPHRSVVWLYSKAIYALNLMNSTSSEFYRINHVIDGMTLHNGKLYWTDSLAGSISSLVVNAQPRTHQVLIAGLDKPRAIVVTDRCVRSLVVFRIAFIRPSGTVVPGGLMFYC